MSRTTIPSFRGTPLPDLETVGLARKMKEAHALIAEQERLGARSEELGAEQERLEQEIKHGEQERTEAWGRALRSGEEAPSDEPIERARRRLEDVRRERAAVRHAADLAEAELKQTVAEHAAEWDRLVQERGEKILAEAQEIAAALTAKLAETEGLIGLHSWLTSGGQFYTAPTPATISIDTLLHERRRDLGLLDVGVIG